MGTLVFTLLFIISRRTRLLLFWACFPMNLFIIALQDLGQSFSHRLLLSPFEIKSVLHYIYNSQAFPSSRWSSSWPPSTRWPLWWPWLGSFGSGWEEKTRKRTFSSRFPIQLSQDPTATNKSEFINDIAYTVYALYSPNLYVWLNLYKCFLCTIMYDDMKGNKYSEYTVTTRYNGSKDNKNLNVMVIKSLSLHAISFYFS